MLFSKVKTELKPSINIICMANYCRSPVTEYLLKKELKGKIEISSSGLNPFPNADMDPRSRKFLEEKGIEAGIHTPRKTDIALINNSSLILALDVFVLTELNHLFKKHTNKIRLLSFLEPKLNLPDPFRMKESEYTEVMNRIEKICRNYSNEFYLIASSK